MNPHAARAEHRARVVAARVPCPRSLGAFPCQLTAGHVAGCFYMSDHVEDRREAADGAVE